MAPFCDAGAERTMTNAGEDDIAVNSSSDHRTDRETQNTRDNFPGAM